MKKILIVEDNEDVRNELIDIFEMEGYKAFEAVNGLEGYLKATNMLPDLIISDILMPVLDGFKMYKELKKNLMTEQIPVIFLSALSSGDDIRKGMNLGAEDYLTKPINPDDLLKATFCKLDKYSKINKRYEEMKVNITNILYHELNTPLNGIIGFSDYLRSRVFEISKDSVKKVADNIYNSAYRLNKLVKKYLIYSELKMQSSNISEIKKLRNCDYTDTIKVINEVLLKKEYKNKLQNFEVSLKSVELKIEERLFKIIIDELIENTVKFSPKNKTVFIWSYVKDGIYFLKVKNHGSGLSEEQLKKIGDFKQFNTKKHAQDGSGIGLSIVKLITDTYGGEIEIESVLDIVFSVTVSFKKIFKL